MLRQCPVDYVAVVVARHVNVAVVVVRHVNATDASQP